MIKKTAIFAASLVLFSCGGSTVDDLGISTDGNNQEQPSSNNNQNTSSPSNNSSGGTANTNTNTNTNTNNSANNSNNSSTNNSNNGSTNNTNSTTPNNTPTNTPNNTTVNIAQLENGQAEYDSQCALCHGDTGEGTFPLKNSGYTLSGLKNTIHVTMPPKPNQDRCVNQCAEDVAAYMINNYTIPPVNAGNTPNSNQGTNNSGNNNSTNNNSGSTNVEPLAPVVFQNAAGTNIAVPTTQCNDLEATPGALLNSEQYANAIHDIFSPLSLDIEKEIAELPTGDIDISLSEFYVSRLLDVTDTAADQVAKNFNQLNLGCNGNRACAQQFLNKVARRAFRREVANNEINELLQDIYDGENNFNNGIKQLTRAILLAAPTLYRYEQGISGQGVEILTLSDKATKLSLLLWNSIPDDQLLDAVKNNTLATQNGFETQVERMIRDDKFSRSVSSFHRHWLELSKNTGENFAYGLTELDMLTTSVFENNGRLSDLLTTQQGFVNGPLAAVYGVNTSNNNNNNQGQVTTINENVKAGNLRLAINAGGNKIQIGNGQWFEADNFSSGGETYSTNDAIDDTSNDALYQSERHGANFGYSLPTGNGKFELTVKLAEIFENSNNQRRFDIIVEGNTVETNVDIFKAAGHDALYDLTFKNINVNDQILNVQFIGRTGEAKVSALLVKGETQGGNITVTTTTTTTTTTNNTNNAVTGANDWQEVQLQGRPGILTRTAFLMGTSDDKNVTSPTVRGHTIAHALLCQEIPEPSAEIQDMFPELPRIDGLTTREELEQVISLEENCSSCHTAMDPYGFALEKFDGSARFRTTEEGSPVNNYVMDSAIGTLNGHEGLATSLAQSDKVSACYASHWFKYAFLSESSGKNRCASNLLKERFEASGGDLMQLIKDLVNNPSFHYREL